MHICCNAFNNLEVKCLKNKIYELFPIKLCSDRIDKKKDGRQYPYLYIPKMTSDFIREYYKDYVMFDCNLHSMAYKFGLPSQTIEST